VGVAISLPFAAAPSKLLEAWILPQTEGPGRLGRKFFSLEWKALSHLTTQNKQAMPAQAGIISR
jgi:hypothetical protein